MSIEAFVLHGYHYGLVKQVPGGPYGGDIELFDIGEEGLVGARYSDNSRQAHPLRWHPGVERALANHVRVRPKLRRRDEPESRETVPAKPRFKKRQRLEDVINNAAELEAAKPHLRPHIKRRHG